MTPGSRLWRVRTANHMQKLHLLNPLSDEQLEVSVARVTNLTRTQKFLLYVRIFEIKVQMIAIL